MLFHAHKKEVLMTCTGTLLLTIEAVFIGIPEITASLPPVMVGKIGILVVEVLAAILLFYGLVIGYTRHRDVTPFLFSVLGLGVLSLYSYGNFPKFLPLLCAGSFLIAGGWNILLASENKSVRTSEAPRLDAFLDNKLLPPEEDENDQ